MEIQYASSSFEPQAFSTTSGLLTLGAVKDFLRGVHGVDYVTVLLIAWFTVWYTDNFGRWGRPNPLLFVPVKDRSEYDQRPRKSRNVAEALKVCRFR